MEAVIDAIPDLMFEVDIEGRTTIMLERMIY
jgi:hypothetical protein